jgi:hypothetical protein
MAAYRVSGVIQDAKGEPQSNADISIKNQAFDNIVVDQADETGRFSLLLDSGLYYALYACKDYKVKNLEYWCWNLPVFQDLEFSITIDGLEIYAVNHYRIQLGPVYPFNLYARVMSLEKSKTYTVGSESESSDHIDIAPDLGDLELECSINGTPVAVNNVQMILEKYPEMPSISGFLATILDTAAIRNGEYNRLDINAKDHASAEIGQATYFWREPNYI